MSKDAQTAVVRSEDAQEKLAAVCGRPADSGARVTLEIGAILTSGRHLQNLTVPITSSKCGPPPSATRSG